MTRGFKNVVALMGCLVILSIAAVGCSPVEKTLKLLIGGEDKPQTEVSLEPVKKSEEQAKVLQGNNTQVQSTTQTAKNAELGSEKVQVVLYFTSRDEQMLVKEVREIPKVESIARATIEQLLNGPTPGSQLVQTIPEGTKLLDINIRPDGLAIASFSSELKAKHTGGSASEGNTVYAIVNTLTQFQSVQRVQILIDNQIVETLAGHLDISQPLERNPELIGAKK
ncbi:MAG: GerMN domain-containing protein [Carboxydocellales bacterium]